MQAVRHYCNNEHYFQVYFDTNRLIRDTFAHAGFPVPEQRYSVGGPEEFTQSEDGVGAFGTACGRQRYRRQLLFLGFPNQHEIGGGVSPDQGQAFTVGRPLIGVDF